MKTKKVTSSYKVILRKDRRTGTEEGCFSSFVPELNISADGDTMEEAIANTEKLIVFHLECLVEERMALRFVPLKRDSLRVTRLC